MGHLLHLFFFVFLDVLGFSIILPLLPYYVAELNASPSNVGLCLTANALSQLITAPYIGKLSDTYGRRPVLLACVLGTCISFIMLYYSTTVEMILASRIVV
jgi:DHA1 family tetracycline resistance protein-like MFS transporter